MATGNETSKISELISELSPDQRATLQWLMDEIRNRFGASDRFDANDPEFVKLAKELGSKVL